MELPEKIVLSHGEMKIKSGERHCGYKSTDIKGRMRKLMQKERRKRSKFFALTRHFNMPLM